MTKIQRLTIINTNFNPLSNPEFPLQPSSNDSNAIAYTQNRSTRFLNIILYFSIFVFSIDRLPPLHCVLSLDARLLHRHTAFPHCGRNKGEQRGRLRRNFRGYLSQGRLNERAEGCPSLMAPTYPRDNLL